MITTSEILHLESGRVFVCKGFEITPNTKEFTAFQNSTPERIILNKNIVFDRMYAPSIVIEEGESDITT